MSRLLGIDFGLKRIGLAISDPLGITAQPLELLTRKDIKEDVQAILRLLDTYEVNRIVIGLPLNMDGSEGFMVDAMRSFIEELKKCCSIEIIEFDERLTSHQAGQALRLSSFKGKKQKSKIDCISAQIILQTYMGTIGG